MISVIRHLTFDGCYDLWNVFYVLSFHLLFDQKRRWFILCLLKKLRVEGRMLCFKRGITKYRSRCVSQHSPQNWHGGIWLLCVNLKEFILNDGVQRVRMMHFITASSLED